MPSLKTIKKLIIIIFIVLFTMMVIAAGTADYIINAIS